MVPLSGQSLREGLAVSTPRETPLWFGRAAALVFCSLLAVSCGDDPAPSSDAGDTGTGDAPADLVADMGDTAGDVVADAEDVGSEGGDGGPLEVTDDDVGDLAEDLDASEPDAGPPPLEGALLEAYCGAGYADVERRIDEALASLTLEQKASLMHGTFPRLREGSWSTTAIAAFDIPGFDMLDGPRGLSRFVGRAGTAFPVAMARGASWDPALEREVGQMIGAELRLAGADVLLAPTVNVLRHPRWGRAQETYGEDPYHLGVMGSAFVEGAQEHVMAVVKHYAANSIENTRLEVNVTASERTLREIYLPHFRAIVQGARVAGVMSAYNRVNGAWASEQEHLLGEVLRDDWGFAGFVVSDFIWGTHDTVPALVAGLDVEMPSASIYGRPVVRAVTDGEVARWRVDAAVRRILRAQWCFEESTEEPAITELESAEALALARRAARRGMVLLENRGAALPIDRSAAPVIAVVGSLAEAENTGDRGSSHVESTDVVTMLEGLTALAGDAQVVHVPGDLSGETERASVAAADMVVAIVGYSETEEGEGQVAAGDRVSLSLPEDDIAVLEAASDLNDRVIAIVVGGSAFVTDGWGDEVEALVAAWYAGAEGGNALAELVYGEGNFSGRLPITFAARDEDYPPFDNESLEVEYGYFHGYRLLDREEVEPLYPFGFGLSYTTFTYGEASVERVGDDLSVTVDVTNEGDVAGIETVQVYVRAPGVVVPRAPRDLRAFGQLSLAAGASDTLELTVPIEDLRYFDEDTGDWALEPGDYVVEVARNAREVASSQTVTLP